MDWLAYLFLVALIAVLPFEVRTFPLASSLQWLFVLLAALSIPILLRERKKLLGDRLVIAGLIFAGSQWLAAALASEFQTNAALGALRITMGLILLCVTLCLRDQRVLMRVWCVSAILAAIYALLDYYGLGITDLFRPEEFYAGAVRRLSGSFEYPNTAAAFFAMSLPLVWATLQTRWIRISASFLLLLVLILTYSRGAIIAVLVMLAVWALAGRSRSAFLFAALAAATIIGFLIFQPFLLKRFADEPAVQAMAAEYEPEFNQLRLHPDGTSELTVRIKNVGTSTWEASGGRPFTLSYRWYDALQKKFIRTTLPYFAIPTPVRPQESVSMRIVVHTPNDIGLHLMTLDISQSGKDWFSGHGVIPGLIEVDIQPSATPSFGHGDLSRWLSRDTSRLFVANVPLSRRELWQAALAMAREHPVFGVGPDNFRLLYGRYFGMSRWNTRIRANSLYLELLSGSGLIGLISFAIMLLAIRRQALVPVIAIGIFLIHGTVDSFLMTTPIYFAFWILIGLAHGNPLLGKERSMRPAMSRKA